jgi:hypothetical protein
MLRTLCSGSNSRITVSTWFMSSARRSAPFFAAWVRPPRSAAALQPHLYPTVDEAGLPGFYVPLWYGLWARVGMLPGVVPSNGVD